MLQELNFHKILILILSISRMLSISWRLSVENVLLLLQKSFPSVTSVIFYGYTLPVEGDIHHHETLISLSLRACVGIRKRAATWNLKTATE